MGARERQKRGSRRERQKAEMKGGEQKQGSGREEHFREREWP